MRKIPLFFLILTFHSCLEEANCLITATNFVTISLKKNSDGKSAASVKFNTISISGTSTLFKADQAVTQIALPVNPDATETTFVFNYATADDPTTNKTSTLTLSYVNESRLISRDCGAYQYQTDLAVPYSNFTKTTLINSSLLTTLTTPNLEIYF